MIKATFIVGLLFLQYFLWMSYRLYERKKHLFFPVQLRVKIITNKLGVSPIFVWEKAPQLNNQNIVWRRNFRRKNVSWNLLRNPVEGVCTSMLHNNNIAIKCYLLYNQTKKQCVSFCFDCLEINCFVCQNPFIAFIRYCFWSHIRWEI